jgi:choline dehydrogenase-like flavoprotein
MHQNLAAELSKQFDYIICGSGSSGSVVAGRLAANPNVNVLLLEAGGSDDTDLVLDTDRWPLNLGGELDWSFVAEPNPNLNGRSILYSMGKVLGGGSSINVGTWSRGHQADWDMYAMSVVDSELRVYGVDNLRIADASILPRVTTGNTMAPCVIVGERAAELLQQEHGAEPNNTKQLTLQNTDQSTKFMGTLMREGINS